MAEKLNQVFHDPNTGIVFISLRPKTQRSPKASHECPGRVILDLDEEGDVYGLRLLGVSPDAARELLRRLKVGDAASGSGKIPAPEKK
jgi:uncharacterized protein YuzE